MEVLSDILYNNLASEMKGIRYDWLWGGEKLLWQGFEAPEEAPKIVKGLAAAIEKATTPLTAASRVIENIGMYPRSDDIIRTISYRGYALKAYHATQKWLASPQGAKDVNKWVRDSGAIHLRRTEQNYAKTLLVTPTKDFGIVGARDLPGHEAVVFWLARELDNSTHFVYARQERAAIEWGSVGRLVTELATFQRQYIQRMWFQFEKFQKADPNQPWAERKDAFRNVMYILMYGSLISTWIGYSTGKRWRSPYNTFDIINWEVGGFALGVAQDFTDFTRNWMIAMNPDTPEVDKKRAVANMITRVTFLGDVLVPLWKVMIDSTDAYITNYPADVRIDREVLKTLREYLDENYTKEEIELAERTWSEKLQKALFGGEPPERDTYEETLKLLQDNEDQLGQMNADFKFYTIDQFGRAIESQRKSAKNLTALPDDMFTEEFFFSPLVQEYFDGVKTYDEYTRTRTDERREFRQKEGVAFEAWMLFWGKVDNTALETNEERAELRRTILAMADRHVIQGIDNKRVFPRLVAWSQMTEEEWLENIKKLDK